MNLVGKGRVSATPTSLPVLVRGCVRLCSPVMSPDTVGSGNAVFSVPRARAWASCSRAIVNWGLCASAVSIAWRRESTSTGGGAAATRWARALPAAAGRNPTANMYSTCMRCDISRCLPDVKRVRRFADGRRGAHAGCAPQSVPADGWLRREGGGGAGGGALGTRAAYSGRGVVGTGRQRTIAGIAGATVAAGAVTCAPAYWH